MRETVTVWIRIRIHILSSCRVRRNAKFDLLVGEFAVARVQAIESFSTLSDVLLQDFESGRQAIPLCSVKNRSSLRISRPWIGTQTEQ
jgi:hypothetical protein